MNTVNTIESQYRKLAENNEMNMEYAELYKNIDHMRLRDIFSVLHYDLIKLFKSMNERLPTGEGSNHYWADESRKLIKTIEIALNLYYNLKNTEYSFDIDEYYFDIIKKCRDFLSRSGGSTIPQHMDEIELYYLVPIFIPSTVLDTGNSEKSASAKLDLIGNGSYANVYKYLDDFYGRYFVLKRAKKDLNPKEVERFKREFETMKGLSSPYVLDVYRYNEDKNEYIAEYMDYTLEAFMRKNNASLELKTRKNLVNQILRAFEYLQTKRLLHRDISPNNILIKEYEDTFIIKVSDFGLVKIPDSVLTSVNTEFKGSFNDPALKLEGFNNYEIIHETYALTAIVHFVMTGKTNTSKITDNALREFVNKGQSPDKSKRFQDIFEMTLAFKAI